MYNISIYLVMGKNTFDFLIWTIYIYLHIHILTMVLSDFDPFIPIVEMI